MERHSPPERAQPRPRGPAGSMVPSVSSSATFFSWPESRPYISSIEIAPFIALSVWPMGFLMAVTFAGQGVIKKQPTSSGLAPVRSQNSLRAMVAATSMGERTSTMFSISSGKRTCMSLTTAGQAEEMRGLGHMGSSSFSFTARATISAPRPTSNTSSKPMRLSPPAMELMLGRFLNCP